MVYLFCGQDSFSKDTKLRQLKERFLSKGIEDFNIDTLYAKESNLKELQEKLLCLPVKAKKRLILIKDAQALKDNVKEFLLKYVKKPEATILLILDVNHKDPKDEFIRQLGRYAETIRFQETSQPDTFGLSRYIEAKKADFALHILNQLLQNGEKPERILGGLRYSWQKNNFEPLALRKRLRLLLKCDIDIKTGRLKPEFALEKLVVSLCCFDKPSH